MYSTSADVIYIVRQPDRCPVTDNGAQTTASGKPKDVIE